MPIAIGQLTIIQEGQEADSLAPLAKLPEGAYQELRRWLFMRLVEWRSNITIYAPTEEQLQEWFAGFNSGLAKILIPAQFDHLTGGLLITYERDGSQHRWEISSHT